MVRSTTKTTVVRIPKKAKFKLEMKKKQLEKMLGMELAFSDVVHILASGRVRIKKRRRRKRPEIIDVFVDGVI